VIDGLFGRLGGDCLGIVREEYVETGGADDKMVDGLVGILIEQRSQARKRKDFAAADAIRGKLNKLGIVLEDKPEGTGWRTK